MTTQEWTPPVAPYSPTDKSSFAYESVAKRWPTILASAIDGLYQASYALSYSCNQSAVEPKIQEAKCIIEKLSGLKHDMGRDKPLELIGEDGGDSTALYDDVIKRENYSWFTAPWLFCECYLYRLLRSYFARSSNWTTYDPFASQKLSAFRSSAAAIHSLSNTVEDLVKRAEVSQQQKIQQNEQNNDDALGLVFRELVQTSLWGNATDLSLLTHLSHADIQDLQRGGVGAEAQAKRQHFILSGLGGIEKAWKQVLQGASSGNHSRVDIILDNSGFELFTDLLLADWLLATGKVQEVVFHPKDMPWFVSDVTPADFAFTISALQTPEFFGKTSSMESNQTPSQPRQASRSTSRQRAMQADPRHFEVELRSMEPAGTRTLQMSEIDVLSRERSPAPAGARSLRMDEGILEERVEPGRGQISEEAQTSMRGRPTAAVPKGSRDLTLDPSYFLNARSRTVSPSRSFVIDSTSSFSSLGISSSSSSSGRGDESGDGSSNQGAADEVGRGRNYASADLTPTQRLARRWSKHVETGRFKLSMPLTLPLGGTLDATGESNFWTSFHNYPSLPLAAPELFASLEKSTLIISKGDLNYRKWTSDAQWPFSTPFEDVLGPVSGRLNLLVLRTNKADVCVGVPRERLSKLDDEDPNWRTNGKFAVVEFVKRG